MASVIGDLKKSLYLCGMISLLLSLSIAADSLSMRPPQDSLWTDTLREITVRPDSLLPVQRIVEEIIKKEREEQIHVPSLGEILQKRFPRLNDIITNPTAIREQRLEGRRRRSLKALEDYDRVRTFDELLREAYEQQMLEDSLARLRPLQKK